MKCERCKGRGWVLVTPRGQAAHLTLTGAAPEKKDCFYCQKLSRRKRTKNDLDEHIGIKEAGE